MFIIISYIIVGPFPWEEKTQGLVLSSFFYGYVVTQARAMSPQESVSSQKAEP